MIWTLLERLHLLRRCDRCDALLWPWQKSPVNGPGLVYCSACFEYYARDGDS